jgi:hypothetical protein
MDCVSVDRDHSNLVKFSEGDSDYLCVLQFLQDIVSHSPDPRFLLRQETQQVPSTPGIQIEQDVRDLQMCIPG